MDQHPDTWTSEGVKGGLELVDPPGDPPSLVAPKADPPWTPPRIIKVPFPEAMSHELGDVRSAPFHALWAGCSLDDINLVGSYSSISQSI